MTSSAVHAGNARGFLARIRDPLAQMLWEARWAGMAAFKEGAAANPFDPATEAPLAAAWTEGWTLQQRRIIPPAPSGDVDPPAARLPYKDE